MKATDATAPSVQTLDRGLKVLHLLAAEPDGLSVSELASQLSVHRAIVYRLLNTLAQHRLVVRSEDGRYRLGVGLVELARGVIPRWQTVAVPELTALAEDLAATAALSVASEQAAVALLVIEPRTTHMHVAYRPGFRHPMSVGAFGKAILAGRPAAEDEPNEIAAARRRGFAKTKGEIQPGAIEIAAPIVIAGWADASAGAVALADFDERAARRVVEAAERIASAFPSASASRSRRAARG